MRRRVLAVIGALAVVAGTASALPSTRSAPPAKAFGISGSVRGLFPGARVPLRLRVANPHPFTIEVRSLTVRVGDAGMRCPARHLSVTRLGRPVRIAARRSRQVELVVRLSADAPDACVGASFPLRYSGRAVRP